MSKYICYADQSIRYEAVFRIYSDVTCSARDQLGKHLSFFFLLFTYFATTEFVYPMIIDKLKGYTNLSKYRRLKSLWQSIFILVHYQSATRLKKLFRDAAMLMKPPGVDIYVALLSWVCENEKAISDVRIYTDADAGT